MNITLQQAYDLFVFDRETYCSDKTVYNYKNTLRYFIDFLKNKYSCESSDIILNDLSILDLQEYVLMLRSRNKLSSHPFKPTVQGSVTNTTIRTYCIDLRAFFNFLFINEYMNTNLMLKFKLIKRENKLVLPLFDDDVNKIDAMFNLKTCSGIRNYCMIHLMLDAGLRSGEVTSLSVTDISFAQNHIIIYNGKGSKDRIILLSSVLKKRLYEYVTLYRPFTASHNMLFCSVDSFVLPITANTIKSLFARIRHITSIERLKPHLLRHTFATSFILGGGDLESLRIYLGHSSYDITQNYLHLANTYSRMGSSIYELDKIFFKSYYHVSS